MVDINTHQLSIGHTGNLKPINAPDPELRPFEDPIPAVIKPKRLSEHIQKRMLARTDRVISDALPLLPPDRFKSLLKGKLKEMKTISAPAAPTAPTAPAATTAPTATATAKAPPTATATATATASLPFPPPSTTTMATSPLASSSSQRLAGPPATATSALSPTPSHQDDFRQAVYLRRQMRILFGHDN